MDIAVILCYQLAAIILVHIQLHIVRPVGFGRICLFRSLHHEAQTAHEVLLTEIQVIVLRLDTLILDMAVLILIFRTEHLIQTVGKGFELVFQTDGNGTADHLALCAGQFGITENLLVAF